jgi:hypothetical protein
MIMAGTLLTATNSVTGIGGDRVEFDGETVTIKRGLTRSQTITIPISRMSSVGWKKSITGKGYIEFIAAGVDGKVEFNYLTSKQFEPMRAAVEAVLAA